MLSRDVVSTENVKSIYKSQTFPTTAYGMAHNLHPDLQEKIMQSFFSFDWKGTKLEQEFERNGESQFIPITYQEHWEVIRTIDAANSVSYSCS